MAHKKNGFWTFIFSLLPGAGEMYLGFMKQGVSLMTLFFGLITFCAFFNFEVGLFILPIIWFYSFFHVHNLNGLPDEEFQQMEDDYLFHLTESEIGFQLTRKKELIIAYGCVLIGIYALWRVFLDMLYDLIPHEMYYYMYSLSRLLPQTILSILLIGFGIHLIRGKKTRLEQEEQADSFFSNQEMNKKDIDNQTVNSAFQDEFRYKND